MLRNSRAAWLARHGCGELGVGLCELPPLDNGGWIAETAMLTLRATFDTRAAACDAHPRWIASLDAMRDRLRDEFAVTELFVSKHRTAAPAPTLVGMD